jgi:hypothetical protein
MQVDLDLVLAVVNGRVRGVEHLRDAGEGVEQLGIDRAVFGGMDAAVTRLSANGGEVEFASCANSEAVMWQGCHITADDLFFRLKDRDNVRAGKARADIQDPVNNVVLGVRGNVDDLGAKVPRFFGKFVVFQRVIYHSISPCK